jgi:cystathionine gamma-synthase
MAKLETVAVHAGAPEEPFGPVTAPISLSSTYRTSTPGVEGPWVYSRTGNPTRIALEEAINALEGGAGAGAFASGMAATDTVIRFFPPNAKVVVSNDVYGGTWRLLHRVWEPVGMTVAPTDLTDFDAAAKALDGAALLIIETPSNPLLRILDIAKLVEIAHSKGAMVCADNTFATPYLQRPLDWGVDFVTHSTTKYLGGHSDVVGGAVVVASKEHAERLHFLQNAVGAVAGPFDSFLVLRGIRTLAVRMDRQAQNALELARLLSEQKSVAGVHYPGLEDDPGFALCKKQMKSGGAMISFHHAGGAQAASAMAQRTKVFALAESLGAVESLIEIPATMTHASAAGSTLEVPPDLVRLSVGLEHIDDLREDLLQALAQKYASGRSETASSLQLSSNE